jgi:L,D-transpeptidase ErfK/SrfK
VRTIVTAKRTVFALVVASFLSGCAAGSASRETSTYRIWRDDTLADVAARFKVGYVELLSANPGTDPWLPERGTKIVVPKFHLPPLGEAEGIVINLADMRLYYFEPGKRPRSYAIGIGREGLTTPHGHTTVTKKVENPTWRPTPRMRREDPTLGETVPPGPDNPMGTRALYLGWRPYSIHGTNKPLGVGRRVSSGCVRMYNDDVEDLFERVAVGTKVTVVDQPIKFGWIDGDLYIEAHPTQSQSEKIQLGDEVKFEIPSTLVAQALTSAGSEAWRVDHDRVRKAARERLGYPIRITR